MAPNRSGAERTQVGDLDPCAVETPFANSFVAALVDYISGRSIPNTTHRHIPDSSTHNRFSANTGPYFAKDPLRWARSAINVLCQTDSVTLITDPQGESFRMSDRPRLGTKFLVRFALWFGLMLAASLPLHGRSRDPVDQPFYDIVAVGRGRGQILLATLASPSEKLQWRFRKIPVSPSDMTVADVVPSAGGTKALVVFADGTSHVLDLTKRITGISAGDVPSPQHRLPQQFSPTRKTGKSACWTTWASPPQMHAQAQ